MPIGKRLNKRFDPLPDSGFANIYFLATTYKANNNSPVRMTIKTGY